MMNMSWKHCRIRLSELHIIISAFSVKLLRSDAQSFSFYFVDA